MKASRRAKKGIQKDELGRLRLLPAMAGNLFLEDEIVRRIDEAILGEDEISDFASPELRSIRRKIQSENAFIREKPVSYTHLDVYKRQILPSATCTS